MKQSEEAEELVTTDEEQETEPSKIGGTPYQLRKKKSRVLPVDEWRAIELTSGDTIAVRPEPGSREPFFLALMKQDVKRDTEGDVDITWLEPTRVEGVWKEGADDKIPVGAMICRINTVRAATKQKRSTWRMLSRERSLVFRLIREEQVRQEFPVDAEMKEGKEEEDDEDDGDYEEQGKGEDEDEDEEAPKAKKRAQIGPDGGAVEEKKEKEKRKRRAPKAKEDEEEGEEEETEEKKGKRPTKKRTREPKKPRAPKKKGKAARVIVDVIEHDEAFEGASPTVDTSCCLTCTAREAIRAVLRKDMALLTKVIDDTNHVFSFSLSRSPDVKLGALEYAVLANDVPAIKAIGEATAASKKRVTRPPCSIEVLDTGSYSQFTFGHRVRRITASRKV